jgi:hypothetical protein
MLVLTAMVQSVIRRLQIIQILCVPFGRIQGRPHGCKCSLLKVREGDLQKGAWWAQVEA